MAAKDLEITCPCCESRIEVDLRTGKVLRWNKKSELDEAGKPVFPIGGTRVLAYPAAHYAVADYKQAGDRYMHRTTVRGDAPY